MEVILVVGHGSRNAKWFEAVQSWFADLEQAVAPTPVFQAYIDHHPERFEPVFERLCQSHRSVGVFPLLLGPGGHLLNDINDRVEQARQDNPELTVTVLDTVIEIPSVGGALSEFVREAISASTQGSG